MSFPTRWPMKRGAFALGPSLTPLIPPEQRQPGLQFFTGMVQHLRERGVDPFECWFTIDPGPRGGLRLHCNHALQGLANRYAAQMRAWPA